MSKVMTLATLIAVFGKEDATPIVITHSGRDVTAVRDDVELKCKRADESLSIDKGVYHITIKPDESYELVKTTEEVKKSRQYPAFDNL